MPTLHFKGKPFLKNYHHAVKFHTLVAEPKKGTSAEPSLDDNLIIHGDNLKALKALLPTHAGKIKCIYIDPPYNTGNEHWVYNDNVNSPMIKEWLGKEVGTDDLARHDKWCCMMYPRLTLLRELLREDGVIFVSIDDNEVANLRLMMDEIFGEENFIQNIIWQKKFSPQNDAKYFSDNHDFIVCYAKNKIEGEQKFGWIRNLLVRNENHDERYCNPDNDPRGQWASSDLTVKTYSPEYDYPITTPSGRIVNPTKGRCWNTSEKNLKKLIDDKRVWFGENGSNVPRLKKFLSEVQEGIVPVSIWLHSEVGHNQEAKQELKDIFKEMHLPFDTPKPVRLIQRIIQLSCGKDDIILDSFAGSGTTAHAVLALNASTSSATDASTSSATNRKFILIECEDYADSITAERVRRVSNGVPTAKDEALRKGLGGSFSFYSLGDAIEIDALLDGKNLPSFEKLAKYAFFTATGENLDAKKINEQSFFVGSSANFEVFLLYAPDTEKLKNLALNLDFAESIAQQFPTRQKLVFAPACFLEEYHLKELGIRFAQLPFEIYRIA
jgi:adenine-specific DNA-methyltransferase